MAELANTLALSAYDQGSTLRNSSVCITDISSSSIHHQDRPEEHESNPRDRDSGVFLSDTEDTLPSTPKLSHPSPISLNHTPSAPARRLCRPAALNLSPTTPPTSKPKSELELRYDLIRNSQSQSKAALKSPTQLLKNRLNLTPTKDKHDRVRVFTPPQPMLNGCILPGPAAQMSAFIGSNVRAQTESEGRPAWWCKFDRLVVFDGLVEDVSEEGRPEYGGMKFRTRSSKGLSIARRRGDSESVVIPLSCGHCQEMLNRSEWKYDVQVCKRRVCWDCRERCRWEVEHPFDKIDGAENGERGECAEKEDGNKADMTIEQEKSEGNRERADSVLQQEQLMDEDLMAKVGIETGLRSPIEAMSGIEERLEGEVDLEVANPTK